jgi:hypothetical protein
MPSSACAEQSKVFEIYRRNVAGMLTLVRVLSYARIVTVLISFTSTGGFGRSSTMATLYPNGMLKSRLTAVSAKTPQFSYPSSLRALPNIIAVTIASALAASHNSVQLNRGRSSPLMLLLARYMRYLISSTS